MTRRIGKREFMVLGKLLVKNRPEIAEELLPSISNSDNETNRNLIPLYYQLFCKLRLADITDPSCSLNKLQKAKERKVFIAVVIRMYAFEVFSHLPANALLPYGLAKQLAVLLDITRSGICQLIRQILHDHRNYEQFRAEVDEVFSSLKFSANGQTETIEH